ncbi:MAG: transposase domain-containing protein [Planctomycetes bacterium]|nr:transposase domain-containing protein [Planctomycetota bacterium]
MSVFGRFHAELSSVARRFRIEALAGGNVQSEVLAALAATGRIRHRESPLQPPLVLWLVLGLTVFRADSIPAVLDRLVSGLRERLRGLPLNPVTDGAIAHARARLGIRPLRLLFRTLAAQVRPAVSFHGLRVWILDGSHLTMPDTPANVACFGRPTTGRGRCAFPQIKLVFLQDAVSRLVRDAAFAFWNVAERPRWRRPAHDLPEQVSPRRPAGGLRPPLWLQPRPPDDPNGRGEARPRPRADRLRGLPAGHPPHGPADGRRCGRSPPGPLRPAPPRHRRLPDPAPPPAPEVPPGGTGEDEQLQAQAGASPPRDYPLPPRTPDRRMTPRGPSFRGIGSRSLSR